MGEFMNMIIINETRYMKWLFLSVCSAAGEAEEEVLFLF